jgi:hypothetical protein
VCGVFWEELAATLPHFAFTHGAGLGVVVKPGAELKEELLCALLSASSEEQPRVDRYYALLAERHRLAFDNAQLRKRVAEPASCSVQAFFSLGDGFRDENSAVRVVQVGKRERIVFELPDGIPADPFRIDPADRPCIVEIFEISVLAADRSVVLWRWDGIGPDPSMLVAGTARRLASDSAIVILSDGADPQVLFPDIGGKSFERPLELELVLQVTACVEYNGAIVPLGPSAAAGAPNQFNRAWPREAELILTEIGAKVQILERLTLEAKQEASYFPAQNSGCKSFILKR